MPTAPAKIFAIAAAFLLVGCASHGRGRGEGSDGAAGPGSKHDEEWHSPVAMLLRYVDKDGKVTRAELEAGLRKDFDAADTNHDGVLEMDEVRAVNEKRWKEDQAAASPLVDWNHDGVVDFSEFAATARSLFDQLDTNGDGVLSPQELNPRGTPQSKPKGQEGGPDQGGHRRRGGQDQGGQNGQGGSGGPPSQ